MMPLQNEFTRVFHSASERLLRAPGRVNLIGEHTDYNDGFVLPMAIDRAAHIAIRRRSDRVVRMCALDFDGALSEFSLDAIARDDEQRWSNYVRGVAWALQARGIALTGADLVIHSDVPIASGLSSSAALEVCAALAFQTIAGFTLNRVEIAQLCQHVENEFLGVQSGIMDQFISALARADHALLIDCRDLTYQFVPLPRGARIVVCDTLKRRGLVASEYNTRRAECEQAARLFGVPALRDVTPDEFARREHELPSQVARRARHIIRENARVLAAVDAARQNDLETFGRLMDESHTSLRDDFAVSCAELDTLVEIARRQPGCWGARLTGAGFGGCTVNLVAENALEAFSANVAREYAARVGVTPPIYACRAAEGAGPLMNRDFQIC
ncbi:MAG: galactokinase [Chloroflexi bacterium]|nr:galactokinase [Chloroflexota bacterium]